MEIDVKELRKMIRLFNKIVEIPIKYIGIPSDIILEKFALGIEKANEDSTIELPDEIIDYYNYTFIGDESEQDEIEPDLQSIKEEEPEEKEEEPEEKEEEPKEKEEESEKEPEEEPEEKEIIEEEPEKPKTTRKRKKTTKRRKAKENSITTFLCKLILKKPTVTRSELNEKAILEYPDKSDKYIYYAVNHVLHVTNCILPMFGIDPYAKDK